MGFIWTNTTLISEEYDIPVKVPHGVVQCRFLDVLDFGVQLRTTYNERCANNTYLRHNFEITRVQTLAWKIENYYVVSDKVLCVEVTIPLMEFLHTKIDDVKKAWLEMMSQVVSETPGFDMSWEIEPRGDDALVTIKIAKEGVLKDLTADETRNMLSAVDALFD